MKITIAHEIKSICPEACLGILKYSANVEPSSEKLLNLIDDGINNIAATVAMTDIAEMPHIKATRAAYKALGKSPQEYRNAAEAMLRRIVKGNGLYRINNIVDIHNLISVLSGYPIGSYCTEKLTMPLELRCAAEGESYQGIGKSSVNIENLPVLYDAEGAFGNPTSDSTRAMIVNGRHEIISVLYAFDENGEMNPWIQRFRELLIDYASAENIEIQIIK